MNEENKLQMSQLKKVFKVINMKTRWKSIEHIQHINHKFYP